jgi:hypothetical protein
VIAAVHDYEPKKPLWITELGFSVSNVRNPGKVPPVTNSLQRQLVRASFSMMQNSRKELNIAHVFYYNIQDESLGGWEFHSGLLTVNNRARPAWTAFSSLAGGKNCPYLPCKS